MTEFSAIRPSMSLDARICLHSLIMREVEEEMDTARLLDVEIPHRKQMYLKELARLASNPSLPLSNLARVRAGISTEFRIYMTKTLSHIMDQRIQRDQLWTERIQSSSIPSTKTAISLLHETYTQRRKPCPDIPPVLTHLHGS